MKLSILHISDLHRNLEHEITNDALLISLERDWLRYTEKENPSIKSPDLIIASGDIIQGVRLGVSEPEKELSKQYAQALEFLSRLSQKLLGGNKDKVIIVPGNHDVSSHHFYQSLRKLDINRNDPKIKQLVRKLLNHNESVRWSWKDLDFYEIADKNIYNKRLESFCNFYREFYDGRREFRLNPDEQFNIYDYPEFNIVVVGLSSCYNNDLYNRQGAINPKSLARATEKLTDFKYYNKLRIGVWHHNLAGTPMQNDYMDSSILQNLIDCGFSLGFHGHQHKPQFIDERFKFGENKKITVISAGTLCGGENSLPSGYSRSYNLVEIDTEILSGKLHLREMQDSNFNFPIWSSGLFKTTGKSLVDFSIQSPPKAPSEEIQIQKRLDEGENYYRTGEYKHAIEILSPLIGQNILARKFILECYFSLEDMKSIISNFDPPQTTSEIIYLIQALWTEGKKQRLHELLYEENIHKSCDPSVALIRDQYLKRLK